MRVLRIDHSSVVPAYRERDRLLRHNYGMDVSLVIPENWTHLGADDYAESNSIIVHTVGTYLTGNIPLFAYNPGQLLDIIREFKPDVVDIHEEPYSVSAFELARLCSMAAPQARCVVYASQNILKRYPPPFCWMEQYVYGAVDAAYACSSEALQVLTQKGFSKPAKIIGLGFDPAVYKPGIGTREQYGVKQDQFVICFCGRIEKSKGIYVLIDAFKSLLDRGIDSVLLLVGSGVEEPAIKRLADDARLQQRVQLLGAQPAAALAEIYKTSDAVVVPSLSTASWKEQFGRVAVEALACRRPLIVSNSGSLPEVVGDGAIVVPEGNAQKLAEELLRLSRERDFAGQIAERGYQRVLTKYTWAKVAEETAQLYEMALGSSGR